MTMPLGWWEVEVTVDQWGGMTLPVAQRHLYYVDGTLVGDIQDDFDGKYYAEAGSFFGKYRSLADARTAVETAAQQKVTDA